MIAAEWKTPAALVRVHDEYVEREPQRCLTQLSRIVSGAYQRRAMAEK